MTKNKLYGFVLLASLAGYIYLYFTYKEAITENSTLCLFRKVTGIPCPACGTTHSIIYIIHGHLLEAFKANPLGFVMFISILVFPVWIGFDITSNQKSFYLFYNKLELFFKKKWVAVFAILFILLLWIVNIYKYLCQTPH
jgi:hypothetical protein